MPLPLVILYRDHSDIAYMRDLFDDKHVDKDAVKIQNPSDLKNFLSSQSVRSCVIFVEAETIQDKLQKKSHATLYEDLLWTVREKVGKDAFTYIHTYFIDFPHGGFSKTMNTIII